MSVRSWRSLKEAQGEEIILSDGAGMMQEEVEEDRCRRRQVIPDIFWAHSQ